MQNIHDEHNIKILRQDSTLHLHKPDSHAHGKSRGCHGPTLKRKSHF